MKPPLYTIPPATRVIVNCDEFRKDFRDWLSKHSPERPQRPTAERLNLSTNFTEAATDAQFSQ